MGKVSFKLLIYTLISLLLVIKGFSQGDSSGIYKIKLNEIADQVNYCFDDLHGPGRIHLTFFCYWLIKVLLELKITS